MIVCGLFAAPSEYSVIEPLYVPALRPVGLPVIWSAPGTVPVAGLAVSQEALEAVEYAKLPGPAVNGTLCETAVLPVAPVRVTEVVEGERVPGTPSMLATVTFPKAMGWVEPSRAIIPFE